MNVFVCVGGRGSWVLGGGGGAVEYVSVSDNFEETKSAIHIQGKLAKKRKESV